MVPELRHLSMHFSEALCYFQELRDFVLSDLASIADLPAGGNYSAALIAMTACDALGRAKYSQDGGARFFGEYIAPETWRPLAKDVYDALRNGLAHQYQTKGVIAVGGDRVEVVVSKKEMSHFSYDPKAKALYVNLKEIAERLGDAFKRFESDLDSDNGLRERAAKVWGKSQVVHVPEARLPEWRSILGDA